MDEIEDPGILAAFRTRLELDLAETIQLIEDSRDNRAPVELDQQSVGRLSRMDAMQQQAMAQDLTRRRQQRQIRLQKALLRITNGEFGYCTNCGEPIALNRLNIDPTFEACVKGIVNFARA